MYKKYSHIIASSCDWLKAGFESQRTLEQQMLMVSSSLAAEIVSSYDSIETQTHTHNRYVTLTRLFLSELQYQIYNIWSPWILTETGLCVLR